ncbi:MAG: AgmX/PglI C-terminal domain-containing protein, partial [Myxococcota bacterium]|nr:AgmX/PglI C-terminal domain-containing protein [Myxococcota bacterium]
EETKAAALSDNSAPSEPAAPEPAAGQAAEGSAKTDAPAKPEPAKPEPAKPTKTKVAAVKTPPPTAPVKSTEKRAATAKTRKEPATRPSPPEKKAEPPQVVVAPAPPPAKRKAASNTSDVNSLLNQLNKKKSGGQDSGKAGSGADSSLPGKLGATAVRGTLKKRHGVFRACYKKMLDPTPGGVLVKTTFVIKGSGVVSKAQILSGAGTNAAVQTCLVQALKGTRFPRFKDPQMTVNYPISLR